MRLIAGLIALCCCCCGAAFAATAEAGDDPDRGPPPRPGHEAPAAPAEACIIRFAWDGYRTTIVVGEGVGMVKPAWVVTWKDGALQVGYRANAFRDARGRLHIDARRSRDVGPIADDWSPDSFAFGRRTLWTLDDRGSDHVAEVGEIVPAERDRAAWLAELRHVQSIIEGGL